MPANGSLRSFISAVTTGETNITRCLERLVNDPGRRQKYAADVDAPHAAVGQLPGWLRNEMVQAGMSEVEVDHAERWPDAEKEKVRKQVAEAIRDGRRLHFGWELYDGDQPVSEVRRDPNQDVRVVFRSPRRGVKLSLVNFGAVTVEA